MSQQQRTAFDFKCQCIMPDRQRQYLVQRDVRGHHAPQRVDNRRTGHCWRRVGVGKHFGAGACICAGHNVRTQEANCKSGNSESYSGSADPSVCCVHVMWRCMPVTGHTFEVKDRAAITAINRYSQLDGRAVIHDVLRRNSAQLHKRPHIGNRRCVEAVMLAEPQHIRSFRGYKCQSGGRCESAPRAGRGPRRTAATSPARPAPHFPAQPGTTIGSGCSTVKASVHSAAQGMPCEALQMLVSLADSPTTWSLLSAAQVEGACSTSCAFNQSALGCCTSKSAAESVGSAPG